MEDDIAAKDDIAEKDGIAAKKDSEVERFVAIQEAAKFLAVKISWIYEQVRLNRMPSHKVGHFRRFKLSELEEWVRGAQAERDVSRN